MGLFSNSVRLDKGEVGLLFRDVEPLYDLMIGNNNYPKETDYNHLIIEQKIQTFELNNEIIELKDSRTIRLSGLITYKIISLKKLAIQTGLLRKIQDTDKSKYKNLVTNLTRDALLDSIKLDLELESSITTLSRQRLQELLANDGNGSFISNGFQIINAEIKTLEMNHDVPAGVIDVILIDGNKIGEFASGKHFIKTTQNIKTHRIPLTQQLFTATNQEVLTADSVSLRCSYVVAYRIETINEIEKIIGYDQEDIRTKIDTYLHTRSQIEFRRVIASYESNMINANRDKIVDLCYKNLSTIFANIGAKLDIFDLKDLTFPKFVQEIFAAKLQEDLKNQNSLETARTQVAAARALRNAAEITAGDPDIKFIRLLETMEKMAAKGRHTFYLGELTKNYTVSA